jgi:transcriptional regulator with XRE-family HTH domain
MDREADDADGILLGAALLLSARSARRFDDVGPHRWIRALRKGLRMTQAELADKAGLTQEEVSRIEGGAVDLRISMLRKLFDVLCCKAVILPCATVEYDARAADPGWMTEKAKQPFDAYLEWAHRAENRKLGS